MTPLRRLLAATATASALALVAACGSSEPDSTSPESSEPTAEATPDGSQDTDDGDTSTDIDSGTDADEITMADVEANATPDSCWTAIDDTVYDLTDWIGSHPGGSAAIEGLCGTDGTAQFTAQHQGQDRPEERLEQFEIGELAG